MDTKTILSEPTALWIASKKTKSSQIAISTRIRLARNLEKAAFPNCISNSKANDLALEINQAIKPLINLELTTENKFCFLKLAEISSNQRKILFEKHFISQNLLEKPEGREVIVNQEQSVAIMINEEDHLRMQCILPDLQLSKAWQKISDLDDTLDKALDFAYRNQIGFLTACPSNLGTGLRASVMLHLPGLTVLNKIQDLVKQMPDLGLTIRGVYGEGSKSYGHLYQISNQVSLGFTEADLIKNLQAFVEKVISLEEQARQTLWQENYRKVVDHIWRSYSLLANAQLMSTREAMKHISVLRLGLYYKVLKNMSTAKLNRLMVNCQAPFLQESSQISLSKEDLAWERAKMIREYFN